MGYLIASPAFQSSSFPCFELFGCPLLKANGHFFLTGRLMTFDVVAAQTEVSHSRFES